jgi:HPt (histidine-containing phosphotransfer) domain-containing protein
MGQNAAAANPGAVTPIDHVHLARYTMGNRPLEIEVLQLFAGQAPETMASLVAASDAKAWHIAAHTLKGSARAVGAWAVATAAEEAEKAGHDHVQRAQMLARIEALLAEVREYIDGLAVAA